MQGSNQAGAGGAGLDWESLSLLGKFAFPRRPTSLRAEVLATVSIQQNLYTCHALSKAGKMFAAEVKVFAPEVMYQAKTQAKPRGKSQKPRGNQPKTGKASTITWKDMLSSNLAGVGTFGFVSCLDVLRWHSFRQIASFETG